MLKQRLDISLDSLLAAAINEQRLPGVVGAVAGSNGIVYESAHGARELGKPTPMSVDTILVIASMTKAVTGAAAMQLVERRKLSLDAPAGELISYLDRVQVCSGFDGAGQPILRPPTQPVTLRNLLTHTSGFVYDIWNADMARYMAAAKTPPTGTSAGLEVPLMFDPGNRWEYGIGIDWAGRLIETVSGQRLGAYMQENIFGPLGMTSTSFAPSAAQQTRLASLHARTPDGITPIANVFSTQPEFDMGGGGLFSTARDYLQFTQMILHGGFWNGARILNKETIALMSRNHIGRLNCTPMRPANLALSNTCDFFPGMAQKWGLTFLINPETSNEGRSPGSLAWAGLANTYYWIDPVKRVTAVLATQLLPFFDVEAIALLRDFERVVYQSLP